MPDRANEYQDPGSNYPDRRDGDVEPGSASSADVTSSSADTDAEDPARAAGLDSPGTEQEAPRQEQNATNDDERIDGIVEQTRADLAVGHSDLPERLLRDRLHDAAIELDDAEIGALVERVTRS